VVRDLRQAIQVGILLWIDRPLRLMSQRRPLVWFASGSARRKWDIHFAGSEGGIEWLWRDMGRLFLLEDKMPFLRVVGNAVRLR
jgi:hypothetical protein